MEIVSGILQFSSNSGNRTDKRQVSSKAVSDGLKHHVTFLLNGTDFRISLDVTSNIEVRTRLSSFLSGPLFVGGVEHWTPEVKDDLSSDQSFSGCFEVLCSTYLSLYLIM